MNFAFFMSPWVSTTKYHIFLVEGIFTEMGYSVSELEAAGDRRAGLRLCLAFEYKVSPRQVISTNPSKPDKQVADYTAFPRNGRMIIQNVLNRNLQEPLNAFIRHRTLDLYSFRYNLYFLVPTFALE